MSAMFTQLFVILYINTYIRNSILVFRGGGGGGGLMTTFGDFWGLMGTKNHGDSGQNR